VSQVPGLITLDVIFGKNSLIRVHKRNRLTGLPVMGSQLKKLQLKF